MAKYNKGILGGFSGNIANVCGSSWKGRAVVRSAKQKQGNRATAAMQSQWNEMRKNAFVYKFLKRIREYSEYDGFDSSLTWQQNIYSLINGKFDLTRSTPFNYDIFSNKLLINNRAFILFEQSAIGGDFHISSDGDYFEPDTRISVQFMFYKPSNLQEVYFYQLNNIDIWDPHPIANINHEFFDGAYIRGFAVVYQNGLISQIMQRCAHALPGDYGYSFDFELYL